MTKKILFYVQHLMGVGHVFRASRIVKALKARGADVVIVYGGVRIANFDPYGADVIYLPALKAGAKEFTALEDENGQVIDQAYRDQRRDMLLDAFHLHKPDVVITEAFPFGRRQMRFELLPLLEAIRSRTNRPRLVCSVRDILQENRKAGRDEETADLVNTHYDEVLVHGDPQLTPFGTTFPLFDQIAEKVRYTGIVAPDAVKINRNGAIHDVVVSVGGGFMGRELLIEVAKARRQSTMANKSWCLIAGAHANPQDIDRLKELGGDGLQAVPFLPDLPKVLTGAELSISRCGYNTVADICRTGCRSVVAPYWDGKETEQCRRAELLAARGLVVALMPEVQNADGLVRAIDQAMEGEVPDRSAIDLNGAERSAALIAKPTT